MNILLNKKLRFVLALLACIALSNHIALANEAPTAEGEAAAAEGEGGESGEGGKSMRQGGLASPYLEFKQINTVGMYKGEPILHMNYIMVLEMANDEEYKYVAQRADLVRSAFVEELHKLGSVQRGGALKNFPFLKRHLIAVANRTVGQNNGQERVKDVLIKATAGRALIN